ncbi:hypothetical protein ACGFIR_21645 [Micromonospora sp. NPDC049051]|uniref:hypothetical protein n=1 Tax=Micromonospora sp. NPDC049051 TaxID=3364264 RepID=UPI003717D63A
MTSEPDVEVSWFWDWVPAAGRDDTQRQRWTGYVAGLVDAWAGEKVAAARADWPADAPEEFPFTAGELGEAVAHDLLARADALAGNSRLLWGAAFTGEKVRWMPLLVVAEFLRARADDPAYLLAEVGAEGLDGDVREPTVDYVSTERGDGVRVFALAGSEEEGAYGRLDAALRLEADVDVDVLLRTRVFGLEQMAAIGHGIEALMHMIAGQSAELRFDLSAGRALS